MAVDPASFPRINEVRLDAQVLGFWMTPFLATLFQNYIAENGGSSKALIMALNR